MCILLANVPHPSIGSRIPDDHLPPLGLLAIGGPLIDDGHQVRLIDAEFGQCRRRKSSPRHSAFIRMPYCSATPARPRAIPLSPKWQAIATAVPRVSIVYGGVFPTYHWREILSQESYATAIVRCEGEETVRRLMRALEPRQPIGEVAGVAYRKGGRPCATRPLIRDLGAYRIGWELIDHAP